MWRTGSTRKISVLGVFRQTRFGDDTALASALMRQLTVALHSAILNI